MYSQFFEYHDRLASQKQLGLVKSDLLPPFITTLLNDPAMERSYKALVLTCLSGGLRISEALALTKEDFTIENGNLFLRSNVLKKRHKEKRWCRIHPLAQEFILSYITPIVGKIFKTSQSTAFRHTRLHFGPHVCNHSLRHSNISYLLFEENITHMKVAKLLHIGIHTIEHYAHLNEKRTLTELFNQGE